MSPEVVFSRSLYSYKAKLSPRKENNRLPSLGHMSAVVQSVKTGKQVKQSKLGCWGPYIQMKESGVGPRECLKAT